MWFIIIAFKVLILYIFYTSIFKNKVRYMSSVEFIFSVAILASLQIITWITMNKLSNILTLCSLQLHRFYIVCLGSIFPIASKFEYDFPQTRQKYYSSYEQYATARTVFFVRLLQFVKVDCTIRIKFVLSLPFSLRPIWSCWFHSVMPVGKA